MSLTLLTILVLEPGLKTGFNLFASRGVVLCSHGFTSSALSSVGSYVI